MKAALVAVSEAVRPADWRAPVAGAAAVVFGAIRRWRGALAIGAPFVLPAEWRAALLRIFVYLGALYGMSLAAAELLRPPEPEPGFEPAPRSEWTQVERPWPAFELGAPGFDELAYAIRRHAGGGRKDVFTFGALGVSGRFLQVEVYRAGTEIADFAEPAQEVRKLAGEQGRVTDLRPGLPIASKFGRFQTFEFAVAPLSGYDCIGFVRAFEKQRLRIGGLSCSLNLVDRSAIACALDRLTLIAAGSAPDIAKLFAHAEQKRHFCGQREPLLYRTSKRGGEALSSSLRLRGRVR